MNTQNKTAEQIKEEIRELEYEYSLSLWVPGTKVMCEVTSAIKNEIVELSEELKKVNE